MTVPALAPFPRLLGLRSWLTVLVPFCALGLLPGWICLALSASLALGQLNDDARSVSALLVLLSASVVSGPVLLGTAPDRLPHAGTLFAQAAVVGLLALASVRMLEAGLRRGLLLPVAAVLLFPGPGGLVALLLAGLGLNGPERRPNLQLDAARPARSAALLLGLLAVTAVVAALLGQIAPPAPAWPPTAAAPAQAAPSRPTAQLQPPQVSRPGRTTGAGPGPTPGAAEDQGLLLRPLVPVTGLLIMICLLLLIRSARLKRREQRSSWTDYLAIVATVATLFMVGVLGAGAGRGGLLASLPGAAPPPLSSTSQAGSVPATAQPHPWLTALLNVSMVVATVFFAAAAVYLALALRAAQSGAGRAAPLPVAVPGAAPPLPPLHRVRLAWRGAETALAAAGLARLSSETPEEYAARLAERLPAAAPDLQTLTRLYLPVRYGGELSEDDAETAEASAGRVRDVLQEI